MVVFEAPNGQKGTFIHIPKTGGSFVRRVLEERCSGRSLEQHAPAHVAQFSGCPHPFIACRRPADDWYLSVWRSRMPHKCESLKAYGGGVFDYLECLAGMTGRRDCDPPVPGMFVGGMPRPYGHQGGLHRLYELIFGAGLIDVWLDTRDLNHQLGEFIGVDLSGAEPVNASNRGFAP